MHLRKQSDLATPRQKAAKPAPEALNQKLICFGDHTRTDQARYIMFRCLGFGVLVLGLVRGLLLGSYYEA